MKPPVDLDEVRKRKKKDPREPEVTAKTLHNNLGDMIALDNVKAVALIIEDHEGTIYTGWIGGDTNALGLLSVGLDTVLLKMRG